MAKRQDEPDNAWFSTFLAGRSPEEVAEIKAFAERAFPRERKGESDAPNVDELIDSFMRYARGLNAVQLDELRRLLSENDLDMLAIAARTKAREVRLDADTAFDLDCVIADVEGQRAVFAHVFETIFDKPEDELAKIARQRMGTGEGYRVFVMTSDEETAFRFAQMHLLDLLKRLRDEWADKFEAGKTDRKAASTR